ncbi:MAG: polysaccharide biosynthesis tyrosine autokinase [Pirellulales bacterium]
MTADELQLGDVAVGTSVAQIVHNVNQFLRTVWYRKNVIVGSFVVVSLLGFLYVATATRYYQANGTILILQSGGEDLVSTIGADTGGNDIMPTHQALVHSAVVLQKAYEHLAPEHRIDLQGVPAEKCGDVLGQNLSVSSVRRTRVMSVAYRSKDPYVAVAVVRAITEAYFEFIKQTHRGSAGATVDVLTRESARLDAQIKQKQHELLTVRQASGTLIASDEGRHVTVETVVQLNDALTEAVKQRVELEARLAAIQAAIRNGEDLRQHISSVEETVGREILLTRLGFNSRDAGAQALLQRGLLQDQAELNALSEHFGANHPRIAEVRERIQTTEQYLGAYQQRINQQMSQLETNRLGPMLIQIIGQSLNNAAQHEAGLRSVYEEANRKAIAHDSVATRIQILQHNVERMERLNDILVDKIATAELQQEHGELKAQILNDPQVDRRAVSPQISLVMLICLAATVVVGGIIVYVQDSMDDRFRSPEELTGRLNVPVLSIVGALEPGKGKGLRAVQSHMNPNASDCESFRTLRTAMALSASETDRMVVSSAEPGDGKTTVLANLAVTCAQSGKRTLLIDGDMRRPGMTDLLDLKGMQGLSNILHEDRDVEILADEYVIETELEGLDVIASGPRRANASELLSSPRMTDLLAWADGLYDQILIDSPPVLAASDSIVLARMVDGLMIVVRPDKNRRRMVMRAVESLRDLNVNLLGIIANCVSSDGGNSQRFDYKYGYGYGYAYEYGHGNSETPDDGGSLPAATDQAGTDDDDQYDDEDVYIEVDDDRLDDQRRAVTSDRVIPRPAA